MSAAMKPDPADSTYTKKGSTLSTDWRTYSLLPSSQLRETQLSDYETLVRSGVYL